MGPIPWCVWRRISINGCGTHTMVCVGIVATDGVTRSSYTTTASCTIRWPLHNHTSITILYYYSSRRPYKFKEENNQTPFHHQKHSQLVTRRPGQDPGPGQASGLKSGKCPLVSGCRSAYLGHTPTLQCGGTLLHYSVVTHYSVVAHYYSSVTGEVLQYVVCWW